MNPKILEDDYKIIETNSDKLTTITIKKTGEIIKLENTIGVSWEKNNSFFQVTTTMNSYVYDNDGKLIQKLNSKSIYLNEYYYVDKTKMSQDDLDDIKYDENLWKKDFISYGYLYNMSNQLILNKPVIIYIIENKKSIIKTLQNEIYFINDGMIINKLKNFVFVYKEKDLYICQNSYENPQFCIFDINFKKIHKKVVEVNHFNNVYVIKKGVNKYFVYNCNNKLMFKKKCMLINYCNERVLYFKDLNGKIGFVDYSGKDIIGAQYDDIYIDNANNIISVRKGDEKRILNI